MFLELKISILLATKLMIKLCTQLRIFGEKEVCSDKLALRRQIKVQSKLNASLIS